MEGCEFSPAGSALGVASRRFFFQGFVLVWVLGLGFGVYVLGKAVIGKVFGYYLFWCFVRSDDVHNDCVVSCIESCSAAVTPNPT